jgi:hypothetical protein
MKTEFIFRIDLSALAIPLFVYFLHDKDFCMVAITVLCFTFGVERYDVCDRCNSWDCCQENSCPERFKTGGHR